MYAVLVGGTWPNNISTLWISDDNDLTCRSSDGIIFTDLKTIEDIGAIQNGYTNGVVMDGNRLLVTYSSDFYRTESDIRSIIVNAVIRD